MLRALRIAAMLSVIVAAEGWSQPVTLSDAEIRSLIEGRSVQGRIIMAEITGSYGRDGRYSFATGSAGSTRVVRGTYQIFGGKVCHRPDDPSLTGGCQKVTREGKDYFYTDDRGQKRLVRIY